MQVASAAVHPAVMAAWQLTDWCPVRISSGKTFVDLWLVSSPRTASDTEPYWRTVDVPPRVAELFTGSTEPITLRVIATWARTLPARLEALRSRRSIELGSQVLPGERKVVLVGSGVPLVARVGRHDGDPKSVRLPQHVRILIGIHGDGGGLDSVLVASAAFLPERDPTTPSYRMLVQALKSIDGRIRFSVDRCWATLLGAPEILLRVVETPVGDDTEGVIRLSPHAFPLIGVEPGDLVWVRWNRRKIRARALESPETEPVEGIYIVGPTGPRQDRPIPANLRIGVPAPFRAALGIPRNAVVGVRRHVASQILGRINELVIPAGGLVAAVAFSERVTPTVALVLFVLVAAITFLPLRHRRPR